MAIVHSIDSFIVKSITHIAIRDKCCVWMHSRNSSIECICLSTHHLTDIRGVRTRWVLYKVCSMHRCDHEGRNRNDRTWRRPRGRPSRLHPSINVIHVRFNSCLCATNMWCTPRRMTCDYRMQRECVQSHTWRCGWTDQIVANRIDVLFLRQDLFRE